MVEKPPGESEINDKSIVLIRQISEILKRCSLLEGLDDGVISTLASGAEKMSVPSETILLYPESSSEERGLFINITPGEVAFSFQATPSTPSYARLIPYEGHFGEFAAINLAPTITVKTTRPTGLIRIPTSIFQKLGTAELNIYYTNLLKNSQLLETINTDTAEIEEARPRIIEGMNLDQLPFIKLPQESPFTIQKNTEIPPKEGHVTVIDRGIIEIKRDGVTLAHMLAPQIVHQLHAFQGKKTANVMASTKVEGHYVPVNDPERNPEYQRKFLEVIVNVLYDQTKTSSQNLTAAKRRHDEKNPKKSIWTKRLNLAEILNPKK